MSPVLLPAAVSALHILGVALGLLGIVNRARALAAFDMPAALRADNAWGISFLLLVGTGLARAFAGLEKGSDFYLGSAAFHAKLGLVALLLLVELWPMITLIRWRLKPQLRDAAVARRMATLSRIEVGLYVLIPFVAAAMARGIGS
ncbi:MAG: DUF2214 family protein [Alphaproteobacteria bacterium]|nr:DUF2214 family protein [Alphaproteobacteria bacterium]